VVVVPSAPPLGEIRRIVVGFDGSEHATAAVRWALAFAGESATVGVVTAIDAAPWIDAGLAREMFRDEIDAQEAEAVAAVAALDPGGRADHAITFADPRRALAEASADADLVVVGARGRGRIASELLGSVATWLLHDASGPVAVVPGA
jgi:nucleotide-binding universal stress UspA family protein